MSRAKRIMVQGTMSGAGKSMLCAALCRIFAQDGYRVAPFKSQNMALNSFVTRDGLEMGRAQVVQAQAAGIEPDVRMNPILLKPSSDTGSQVIVGGEVRGQMSAADYFKMKRQLIPDILAAFNSLSEDVDIVVIEGAGSPAEINLKADDIVNMGLAKLVDAPVLLAACSPSFTARWRCLNRRSARALRGWLSTSSAATWRFCGPAWRCWRKRRACPFWALCRICTWRSRTRIRFPNG